MESNMKNGPAHKFQDGCLKSTIWRNTSTEGKTYYSFNITRSYKAGDDTWRETDSFTQDDALPMAELLRETYAYIKNAKKSDSKAARERDQVSAK
jgi:hypothetical protein